MPIPQHMHQWGFRQVDFEDERQMNLYSLYMYTYFGAGLESISPLIQAVFLDASVLFLDFESIV